MTEDIIELVPGVRARLIPGAFPPAGVRELAGYLCIGVAPTHPDSLKVIEGTIGSSTDAIDEWRFDVETGDMVSAYWDDWRHVLALPLRGSGTLRLIDRRVFVLPQPMIGAFDPRGSALICMMQGTRPVDVEYRIEFAPDVFLFVSGGRHCGWALLNPTDKACLRGEELEPLPTAELAAAREPLAQTLAGIFDLYTDEGVTLDKPDLEQRLDELGANLVRRVSPVASRVMLDAIESWYLSKFITFENAVAPWIVAEARQLKSGQLFRAANRDARALRRRELHPLIRERVDIEERIVRLHRQLRWPEPRTIEGQSVDSTLLGEWRRIRPELILEQLAAANIPAEVTGLSTLGQFSRVNTAVAELERQKGAPLRMLDWMRFIDAIGTHGEVKAVHDGLVAAFKAGSGGKKGKRRAGKPPTDPLSALADLELSLTQLSLDDESKDRHVPRCVHCQFVTHGVIPDEDLLRVEAAGTPP